MHILVNFIAFQAGWFASVLGAAAGAPWIGPMVLAVVLCVHFNLAERPLEEARLVLVCAAVGACFDSVFVASGWIVYPSGQWHAMLAPYWIVGMWMLFATTLNVSLKWLKGRPALAALLGAVAGPLSYVAGEKLGGLTFTSSAPALAGLALGWALALPLVARLAATLDGVTPSEARA